MSDLEFTGKTVEEAIEEGLSKLNLTKEQADITVLEEPAKGLLRFKKAKVKISKKMSDGERAVDFIDDLLYKMNFNATSELKDESEKIIINLITTNSSSIIGYRGEVLDAFQTLAGAVANIGRENYKRVVVDCENYRAKREDTLKNLADKLADKAVTKARKITLEPMNPYERRIIHSALADNADVKTISEGKEPNRFISIIPNNMKHYHNDKFRRNNKYKDSNNSRTRKESSLGNGYSKPKKEYSAAASVKAKKSSFGTYLGNSLKD